MTIKRSAACFVVASLLSTSAFAQQPIQESAKRLSGKFWTGLILGAAGGTAVVLGGTVLKTSDATSGNTPEGAYDACVALKANPVYRGNQCDVLQGPNTAVVVGGVVALAAGTALMIFGRQNNSVTVGAGGVKFQHRVSF
jgi:hypothetical protein